MIGWSATPSGAIGTSGPAPFEGNNYFASAGNATTTLVQTIDLLASGFTATQLDTQDLSITFGGRVRSGNETPRDSGRIFLTLLDGSDSPIGSAHIAESSRTSDRWELIGGRAYLPTGVRKVRFEFQAVRQSGATNDAYLDRAFVTIQSSNNVPDAGASGWTSQDVPQPAHLVLRSPDLYKDWQRDKPLPIRWDSFGNSNDSPVRIDLYQDAVGGPVYITTIAASTSDDGEFTWIAANSGINYGTYGLRVQISLVDNTTVLDRSTESFTVPENTNTFFVNDASIVGDQYVSVVGNNRQTGKLASTPKPYPNNVLRIYELGANQTLSIDRGTYPLLYPLIVSNSIGLGNDEGFLLRGASGGTTQLLHANSLTIAPFCN